MSISWKERFDLSTVEEVLMRRWGKVLSNIQLGAQSPLIEKSAANLNFLSIPDLEVRTISIAQLSDGPDLRLHSEFWRTLSDQLTTEIVRLVDDQRVYGDFGWAGFTQVSTMGRRLIGQSFAQYRAIVYRSQADDRLIGIGLLLENNLCEAMAADLAYTWQHPDAQHYFIPLMDLMAAGNWPLGFIEPNVLLVLTS